MSWQQPSPAAVLPNSAHHCYHVEIFCHNLEDRCLGNDEISLGKSKVAATGIIEYSQWEDKI